MVRLSSQGEEHAIRRERASVCVSRSNEAKRRSATRCSPLKRQDRHRHELVVVALEQIVVVFINDQLQA
mgnify:CR=1 FL=1